MPSPQLSRVREVAGRFEANERPHTTNNTPRKPEKIDIGKQRGHFDTDKIRTRVLTWQSQNSEACSSEPSDSAPDESPERPSRPRHRINGEPRTNVVSSAPDKYISMYRPASQNRIDTDIRGASSPKRKIVSDDDWKRKQNNVNATAEPIANFPPKQEQPQHSATPPPVLTPGWSTCDAWVRKKSPEREQEKPKKEDLNQVKMTPAGWVRPRPVPPKQTPQAKPESPKKSPRHGFVDGRLGASDGDGAPLTMDPDPIVAGDGSPKKRPDLSNRTPVERNSPRDIYARANRGKPALDRRRQTVKENQSPAVEKAPAKETRKSSSHHIETNTPPPNRIEAWLGATPDPFVEDPKNLDKYAAALPSDLGDCEPEEKHKSQRRDRARNQDPDTSMSKPYEKRRGRRRQSADQSPKEQDSTPELVDDDDRQRSPSSSPLKRSGARRNTQSSRKASGKAKGEQVSRELGHIDKRDLVVSKSSPFEVGNADEHLEYMQPLTIAPSESAFAPPIKQPQLPRSKQPRPNLGKRKLTSHGDLISVLSMEPGGDTKSLKSACSVRSSRARPGSATMDQIMAELRSDEVKYLRELRTLVDGVIPVLLSCVLSKSNKAATADLLGASSRETSVTAPIVNMGIALERLQSTHKRMPSTNGDALLFWAQNAQRVYTDYIKAYRMGFQDIVVNLAPAEGDQTSARKSGSDMLPRNTQGDVVDEAGEKVDVAFLLKRPLVRLKHLAKTLKAVAHTKNSDKIAACAEKYQDLVQDARKRQDEERARLEDEAASSIDVSRARDLKTLGPSSSFRINPWRCVRARDLFDLHIQHSTGQRVDCRVELIIRDDPHSHGCSGDVLVCEVDQVSRWLLLPPIQLSQISARRGEHESEIVALVRGNNGQPAPWQEFFVLSATDFGTVSEWLQMLGKDPVPPQLPARSNFLQGVEPTRGANSPMLPAEKAVGLERAATRGLEIPMGEQASIVAGMVQPELSSFPAEHLSGSDSSAIDFALVGKRNRPVSTPLPPVAPASKVSSTAPSTPRHGERLTASDLSPRDLDEAMQYAGSTSVVSFHSEPRKARRPPSTAPTSPFSSMPGDKESKAAKHRSLQDWKSEIMEKARSTVSSSASQTGKGFSVWIPQQQNEDEEDDYAMLRDHHHTTNRRSAHRSSHSTPHAHMRPPLKQHERRESSRPEVPPSHSRNDSSERRLDDYLASKNGPDMRGRPQHGRPVQDIERSQGQYQPPQTSGHPLVPDGPPPTPSTIISNSRHPEEKRSSKYSEASRPSSPEKDQPPLPPAHRNPVQLPISAKTPVLEPSALSSGMHRRSSSPLKHEYAPSEVSDDSSLDANLLSDDAASISSASSADDIVPSLPPMSAIKKGMKPHLPPHSTYSPRDPGTVAPSQSASQAPYRTVPPDTSAASQGKQIASMFCWSDKGAWESLHPDECSIIVSPGLIEAFEMSAAHSSSPNRPATAGEGAICSPRPEGVSPLIGLELTPLVPMRRGTAIDISIRSPPTTDSQIKRGTNIMFRSRNNQECDILYNLINQARINNPTYIALQNARGPGGESSWASAMDRRSNAGSKGPSWWRFGVRRSSYRAGSSRRTPSVAAQTESSVTTATSALSALKRFSGTSKVFDVAKSTVTSRKGGGINLPGVGTRSSTTFSSGGNSGGSRGGGGADAGSAPGSGTSTPPAGTGMGTQLDPNGGGVVGNGAGGGVIPLGINSAKIRIYERESANKWRDMGSARLNIMHPPRPKGQPPPLDRDGRLRQEKRVLITGKTKGETLLDVTLGEGSFERVARTGIAVSVWEGKSEVGKEGSVLVSRVRVFMLQMKSEAETAYTFSLVGRLRY